MQLKTQNTNYGYIDADSKIAPLEYVSDKTILWLQNAETDQRAKLGSQYVGDKTLLGL